MKRALLSAALAVILAIPASAFNIRKVSNAVVHLVKDGRAWCSATWINEDQHYILTAAHCVAGVNDDSITVDGHKAFVVVDDDESDLAVLQTPDYTGKGLKMQTYPAKVEQLVRIVGYPNGYQDQQVFRGFISNPVTTQHVWEPRHDKWMAFDMLGCGGNSGSAVVNEKDEIVSVLQLGHGRPCDGFTGGAIWADMVRVVYKYFKR